MATLTKYLQFTDEELRRFDNIYADYRRMYQDPDNCRPMFIIQPPAKGAGWPTWEERLADPLVMLKAELDNIRSHVQVGDDATPTVRVQFGTAQVAAAFGCEMFIPENNLPAAGTHVLTNLQDVYTLPKPSLTAGWYGKLAQWTEVFRENLPAGVHIQHPDIQSPFNTAHLIRGNDIMTDLYDDPAAVEALLKLVADYMIDLVPHLKAMISQDREWFFDYFGLWRGTARISNCTMHMIGPDFYVRHVLPQDIRLMEAIGGGRIHYCGSSQKVVPHFFENPMIHGLDFHSHRHDLWDICKTAPKSLTLMTSMAVDSSILQRLLSGDWPAKRNLIIGVPVANIEQGREVLAKLKKSLPG